MCMCVYIYVCIKEGHQQADERNELKDIIESEGLISRHRTKIEMKAFKWEEQKKRRNRREGNAERLRRQTS